MKKLLSIILLSCVAMPSAMANLIANGSFENTTSVRCNSNLGNAQFNAVMSDVTAFGTGSELDIYTGLCFGPEATDGDYKVNMVSLDAFTMALTEELVVGSSYTLSFDTVALSNFNRQLDSIFIGTTTSATATGIQIFEAVSTVLDEWQTFSTTFEANSADGFLSVFGSTSALSWHSVDNFSLTLDDSVVAPVNAPAGFFLLLPLVALLYRQKS